MNKKIVSLLILSTVIVSGCSKRPVIYEPKDSAKAQVAIDECIKKAEAAQAKGKSKLEDSAYRAVAGGAASAAAGGAAAATGNMFNSGRYDVGASAGMSAAAGGAGNFVLGLFDDDVDPIFANYVGTCLSGKGYKVIGWK